MAPAADTAALDAGRRYTGDEAIAGPEAVEAT